MVSGTETVYTGRSMTRSPITASTPLIRRSVRSSCRSTFPPLRKTTSRISMAAVKTRGRKSGAEAVKSTVYMREEARLEICSASVPKQAAAHAVRAMDACAQPRFSIREAMHPRISRIQPANSRPLPKLRYPICGTRSSGRHLLPLVIISHRLREEGNAAAVSSPSCACTCSVTAGRKNIASVSTASNRMGHFFFNDILSLFHRPHRAAFSRMRTASPR